MKACNPALGSLQVYFFSKPKRRGARVVESAGLENRCTLTGTVGSNPTLSATEFEEVKR
jgi:hypothetical protein